MLRIRISVLYFFLMFLLQFGCSLVTWEQLDIQCNISDKQIYFFEDYVTLVFSGEPKKNETEKYVQLKANELVEEVAITWSQNTMYVVPVAGWQKGMDYEFIFSGSVALEDGRIYKKSLTRFFTYGEKGKTLKISSISIEDGSTILEDEKLTFTFNGPVSITSFIENFDILPFIETSISFTENNTIAHVQAQGNWGINAMYDWTISDLQSADKYLLEKKYEGKFYTKIDTVQPTLLQICPVDDNFLPYYWLQDLVLTGNIFEKQPIGFIFSKPMNKASVESGITFSPAIEGYFNQVSDDATSFIFYPEKNYEIGTNYRITVSEQIEDTHNVGLYESYIEYFLCGNDYLTVSSINFDSGEAITKFDNEIKRHSISNLSGEYQILVNVAFSSAIEKKDRKICADSIGIEPHFPSTASTPSLLSVTWNFDGTMVNTLWEGVTPTTIQDKPNIYKIEVKGGPSGPVNLKGEYMQEDVCVYANFEPL